MEWMLVPLKRYAEFSGRSRRMEYWMWIVFQFLIGIAFWILMMLVAGFSMFGAVATKDPAALAGAGVGAVLLLGLWSLIGLGLIIPSLAVAVRRLHDTNRSGWWILAPLVPYVLAFALMFGSGSKDGFAAAGMLGFLCILAAMVLGLVLLVFMFLDGTPGPNRYGPDPKGRASATTFA